MHGSATTKAMDESPGAGYSLLSGTNPITAATAGRRRATVQRRVVGAARRGYIPGPVGCLQGDARLEETYRTDLAGGGARPLLPHPPHCLLARRRKGGGARD